MKFASTALVFLAALVGKASASGGSCACEAEELGFKIDCANTQAMLDALQFLKANACATECSSEECEKNYYIVQAHHDFCPEADIPEDIEDGFHDFDESCVQCDITRAFIEGAPTCPVANCEDSSGNDAYTALVENGCNISCDSDVCRDLFFVLRIVHDDCPHDTLSRAAEEGLHDLERPCASQLCNHPDGATQKLVCEDHSGHGHGDMPYEWAAVFPLADATHTYVMQQVDGKYADPSMKVVLIPTSETDIEGIHTTEEAAAVMIEGDCVVVNDGETAPAVAAEGSCFDLTVGSGDTSRFTLTTEGLETVAMYTAHSPYEFERDEHFLQDSAGADVEPLAEEAVGGGHGGHDHGGHDHGDHDEDSGAAGLGLATAAFAGIVAMAL